VEFRFLVSSFLFSFLREKKKETEAKKKENTLGISGEAASAFYQKQQAKGLNRICHSERSEEFS